MVVIIAVSATLIACLTKYKGMQGDGPIPQPDVQKILKVGLVFA